MRDPRAILITGASGGIGGALARLCKLGGISGDHWPQRRAPLDRASPLDLVIANAGITGGIDGDSEGETLADVQRILKINFGGVCSTVHPVVPAMRRRGRGQLALMSSLAALRGLPYSLAYCASKAALKAYGEALRAWLRPQSIEVSVVLPGFVDTKLAGHVAGPKPLQMTAERAARIIRRRLARNDAHIAFPLLLHWCLRIAAILPPALVDSILTSVKVDIRRYEWASRSE
ncbi:MAG TPA: SDR family NAD(P)-dependent oxidoreductase [Stellaceae bacterium]|nr:SDR family NAD(P)-dependent oxidoreductase [Stellaceae bacterium]